LFNTIPNVEAAFVELGRDVAVWRSQERVPRWRLTAVNSQSMASTWETADQSFPVASQGFFCSVVGHWLGCAAAHISVCCMIGPKGEPKRGKEVEVKKRKKIHGFYMPK